MVVRASEVFPDDEWVYCQDPHDIIPLGLVIRNEYVVVYFCAPAGDKLKDLMVGIKYVGGPDTEVCSTTLRYLSVLRDYFMQLSHDEFVDIVLR